MRRKSIDFKTRHGLHYLANLRRAAGSGYGELPTKGTTGHRKYRFSLQCTLCVCVCVGVDLRTQHVEQAAELFCDCMWQKTCGIPVFLLEIRYTLDTAPVSNSWIIFIIWIHIALNRTPNIDCYWGGGQYASYTVVSITKVLGPRAFARGSVVTSGMHSICFPPSGNVDGCWMWGLAVTLRVHVPNNGVLGILVLVIIVQILGKNMIVGYLDR